MNKIVGRTIIRRMELRPNFSEFRCGVFEREAFMMSTVKLYGPHDYWHIWQLLYCHLLDGATSRTYCSGATFPVTGLSIAFVSQGLISQQRTTEIKTS